jgi:hypothetical protein
VGWGWDGMSISEVLSDLAKKELQTKLFVGYQDSINGYGWHVVYYVEIIKCIEYCEKCRKNHNVNYKDDYYPNYHQHAHRHEYKIIYENRFRNEADMILELKKLL